MTRNEYTVDELADVLLRAGFVECNIAACNCGSWHHRYGLPERFSEIKDALMDAGVLNNETGNLPIRAIAKLVEQRDALRSRLAEAERERDEAVELLRESRDDVAEASNRTHKPHAVAYYKEQLASIDAFLAKIKEQP